LPAILQIILTAKAFPHPLQDLRPETKYSSRGKSFGMKTGYLPNIDTYTPLNLVTSRL